MQHSLYLLCLFGAIGCLMLLDARLKLVLWRNTKRAVRLLLGGVGFFLLWDILGIALHIFAIGDGHILSGPRLLPNLPIEEPFFLLLLMYQSLIAWEATSKLYEH